MGLDTNNSDTLAPGGVSGGERLLCRIGTRASGWFVVIKVGQVHDRCRNWIRRLACGFGLRH